MLNYFSVEKTRIGEGFAFEVDVEIESAPYSLLITPFLLQPFIENSIKHGMTEDMESGFVKVLYKEQNGAIHCSIEDDGVGRTGTKLKSNTNHVSHGLNIAFERIDLFNKSNGFVGERRTIDLVDENETPKGTRVEFTVPALKAK
jgi:sensor histidine kinase YesM